MAAGEFFINEDGIAGIQAIAGVLSLMADAIGPKGYIDGFTPDALNLLSRDLVSITHEHVRQMED